MDTLSVDMLEKQTHTLGNPSLPSSPGVYIMKDSESQIIYVGKALNLRKRLASYVNPHRRMDRKTRMLINKIATIETIVTASEKEALILESNLIKRHRPKYNVVLKDDKRYPVLRLDIGHTYPHLRIVRKFMNDGALYFGPYSSAKAVRETLKIVNKTFKLRKCKDRDFRNRTRPCLHCQMQGCLAPCCRDVHAGDYRETVKEVVLFLKGRTPDLIRRVEEQMRTAAENQEYEKAAALRDKMTALKKTVEKQVAVSTDLQDRDVLNLARAEDHALISLMLVRGGFLLGMRHFWVQQALASDSELLETFIQQYYEGAPSIPREILAAAELDNPKLISNWLSDLKGVRVVVAHPKRGEKRRLLDLAGQNAENEIKARIEALCKKREVLARLQQRLDMDRLPERIECIDNSNIGGRFAVSSLVVFKDAQPDKAAYRHYKIKGVQQADDYATMVEVLTRRFKKHDSQMPEPDLLMVDGGKGQLNVAVAAVKALGIRSDVNLIGIAKPNPDRGETTDKIFLPGRSNPLAFPRGSAALRLLQHVRDEAHRFAISYHRQQRRSTGLKSRLDAVAGIGPKRKALLLNRFGSIDAIRDAEISELASLPGINARLAETIKAALK